MAKNKSGNNGNRKGKSISIPPTNWTSVRQVMSFEQPKNSNRTPDPVHRGLSTGISSEALGLITRARPGSKRHNEFMEIASGLK